jgi:EmrB/QacA subfamily drug resistance transporter
MLSSGDKFKNTSPQNIDEHGRPVPTRRLSNNTSRSSQNVDEHYRPTPTRRLSNNVSRSSSNKERQNYYRNIHRSRSSSSSNIAAAQNPSYQQPQYQHQSSARQQTPSATPRVYHRKTSSEIIREYSNPKPGSPSIISNNYPNASMVDGHTPPAGFIPPTYHYPNYQPTPLHAPLSCSNTRIASPMNNPSNSHLKSRSEQYQHQRGRHTYGNATPQLNAPYTSSTVGYPQSQLPSSSHSSIQQFNPNLQNAAHSLMHANNYSQYHLPQKFSNSTVSDAYSTQQQYYPEEQIIYQSPTRDSPTRFNSLGLKNKSMNEGLQKSVGAMPTSWTPVPPPRKPSLPDTPPNPSAVKHEVEAENIVRENSRPLAPATPILPEDSIISNSNAGPLQEAESVLEAEASPLEAIRAPPQIAKAPLVKVEDSILIETGQRKIETIIEIESPPPNLPKLQEKSGLDIAGQERTFTRAEHVRLFLSVLALASCLFLGFMDTTIVSTALPAIASYFNALDGMNWVITSYLLTSTALQPLYGKFANIFGRKMTLLTAVFLFLLGSLGCGVAPNLIFLIVSRAVAGVGGGGLYSLCIIIVSDLVPIRLRSAYMTVLSTTFAFSSVVGPIAGGYMVDYMGWRWAFYINLPIGVVAIVMVLYLIEFPDSEGSIWSKLQKVDFIGCIVLIFGTITLMFGTNFSSQYGWGNILIVWLLLAGIVILFIFMVIEFKAVKDPIVPYEVFNRTTTSIFLAAFFQGFILMVTIFYIPMFFQIVQLDSASNSGLQTLPFLLSMVIVSTCTGFAITYTDSYRIYLWTGGVLMTIGVGLFSTITDKTAMWVIYIYQVIIGTGCGLNFQPSIIAVQVKSSMEHMPIVTALLGFTRSMGGIFGISIFGSLFNSLVSSYIQFRLKNIDVSKVMASLESISKLPAHQLRVVRQAYMHGLKWIYLILIPISIITLLISLFAEHKSLKPVSRQVKTKKEGMFKRVTKVFRKKRKSKELLGEIVVDKLNDSEEDIYRNLSPIPAPRPFSSFAGMEDR